MPTATENSFGDLLRTYRRAAGLSQEELAERANLSPRTISDLERGLKAAPHRETVRLLVLQRRFKRHRTQSPGHAVGASAG
jgi:transcriptional regulator with XRE-family HTH domain